MKLVTVFLTSILLLPATVLADGHSTTSQSLGNRFLTSGPVASLFARLGVNITKTLEQPNYWDERIPLITDDNYNDIIVNEPLTDEELQDRTWAIIITAAAGDSLRDSLSKLMDDMFDAAYNETVLAGDIPNVRWGRIDYLNVTYLTTKWNVWSTPYLVILRNRGQELPEDWKYTPVWSSSFAPGGDKESVMHYFAIVTAKVYTLTISIPRWLFVLISGAVGSLLLGLMHTQASPKPKRAKEVPVSSEKTSPATPSAVHPKTSDSTKKRKRR
ncbi:hypothetical protein F5887DRAFT_965740 [Amanita rubescens]|nr:hypothetical protein F5887DRAFT_965740 [Amanita rubescens]